MSATFFDHKLFNTLQSFWWWEGMFADAQQFVHGCPKCAVASHRGSWFCALHCIQSLCHVHLKSLVWMRRTDQQQTFVTSMFWCSRNCSQSGLWLITCWTRSWSALLKPLWMRSSPFVVSQKHCCHTGGQIFFHITCEMFVGCLRWRNSAQQLIILMQRAYWEVQLYSKACLRNHASWFGT